nr:succinate dehydrogenase assembly factor 1, mitochondrial-like [Ipomoea batatas]
MGASSGQRLSGMQKQVLSLYRGFLRAARAKPPIERRQIESLVTAEFRHNAMQVDRKNFMYIEYLLRRGMKQLDQLKSPDIVGLSSLSVESSQTRRFNTTAKIDLPLVAIADAADLDHPLAHRRLPSPQQVSRLVLKLEMPRKWKRWGNSSS